jgi:hypothetical protein
MAAQLAATVYVTDPDSHQTVTLAEGSSPEPRLAVLVPNPAAWVDRKLPRLPKAKTEAPDGPQGPTGAGQDDASGGGSDTSGDGDTSTTKQAAPAAKKTATKKAAAPARGRAAAGEGDSGA